MGYVKLAEELGGQLGRALRSSSPVAGHRRIVQREPTLNDSRHLRVRRA